MIRMIFNQSMGLVFMLIVTFAGDTAKAGLITFSSRMNISNMPGFSSFPSVTTIGSNLYLVWQDSVNGDNNDIFFSKSTDGGSTWSSPLNLTPTRGSFINDELTPRIATDGANLYVTYTFTASGSPEIFFLKSTDGGSTWSTPINISNNSSFSGSPDIITVGNDLYVFWKDRAPGAFSLFFSKSTDGGNTWSTPQFIARDIDAPPRAATDGTNLYVVWNDNFVPPPNGKFAEVFFSKSTDGGSTWSTPLINISKSEFAASNSPQIVAIGPNLYVVWFEATPQSWEILFSKSIDAGSTWSTPINISNTPAGSSFWPDITTDGINLYAVWRDSFDPTDPQILFSESTDAGNTWTTPIKVTNPGEHPQIATDGSKLYVFWEAGLPGLDTDIFLSSASIPSTAQAVPEPGTLVLFLLGIGGVVGFGYYQRRR